MKILEMNINEASEKAKDYDYTLAYKISSMCFGKACEFSPQELDQLEEAYCFSESGQLHIFREDGALKAVAVEDEQDDVYELRAYQLNEKDDRVNKFGKELIVKEYIAQDRDGQAYIQHTRMMEIR